MTITSTEKNYHTLWYTNTGIVEVGSDGDQFIATLHLGIDGETYVSVGYSCPNYAWEPGEKNSDQFIQELRQALYVEFNRKEFGPKSDVEEYLPGLLRLCQVANKVFNQVCLGVRYAETEPCE